MPSNGRGDRLDWRMFFTGRGVHQLSASSRLVLDLISLGLSILVALGLLLITHNTGAVWTYVVAFGGLSLLLTFGRYWRDR